MSVKEKFYDYVAKKKERRKSVEIQLGEEKLIVYFTPMSVLEGEKIRTQSRVNTGSPMEYRFDAGMLNIMMVIEKTEDEEGNKIFTMSDLPTLQQMDEAIIVKIVNAISPAVKVEEIKNA